MQAPPHPMVQAPSPPRLAAAAPLAKKPEVSTLEQSKRRSAWQGIFAAQMTPTFKRLASQRMAFPLRPPPEWLLQQTSRQTRDQHDHPPAPSSSFARHAAPSAHPVQHLPFTCSDCVLTDLSECKELAVLLGRSALAEPRRCSCATPRREWPACRPRSARAVHERTPTNPECLQGGRESTQLRDGGDYLGCCGDGSARPRRPEDDAAAHRPPGTAEHGHGRQTLRGTRAAVAFSFLHVGTSACGRACACVSVWPPPSPQPQPARTAEPSVGRARGRPRESRRGPAPSPRHREWRDAVGQVGGRAPRRALAFSSRPPRVAF